VCRTPRPCLRFFILQKRGSENLKKYNPPKAIRLELTDLERFRNLSKALALSNAELFKKMLEKFLQDTFSRKGA
jgi:hypothetical protein